MSTAIDGPPETIGGPVRLMTVTAEQVAKTVEGISFIGHARAALDGLGLSTGLAGNRITINGAVEAQFVPATMGQYGRVCARWVVTHLNGQPPVWVVGAAVDA